MGAYELAIQNFAVAEHLLQLYQLFRDLREKETGDDLRLMVCRCLGLPENMALITARNDQMLLAAQASAPIPRPLLMDNGADFLLRQAVVVSCTALESFFWDSLRENVLTIIRARKRGADESLRKLVLTLDDYMSLENYTDRDERLQQIILKNYERGTLYDTGTMDNIAKIMTVRDFWTDVSGRCGQQAGDLMRSLNELIQRRNQIAHRADRPNPDASPADDTDIHGLRAIGYAWVNTRISLASSVVEAAHQCFRQALRKLEQQLLQEKEQELARRTLKGGTTGQ